MPDMALAENEFETLRRKDVGARRCIVSGAALPRDALIRFVVGPDDIVVPDLAERLPGRGLWLTGRYDIVAQAGSGKAFCRAARRQVTPLVGPDGESLADVVDAQLAQRCLQALGLARRAGLLELGFEKVQGALKSRLSGPGGGPVVLLSATDAAADGRRKLASLGARLAENGTAVANFALFDAKTLGSAVGREQIVHALVKTDAVGGQLGAALRRLATYRGAASLGGGESGQQAPSDVGDMD